MFDEPSITARESQSYVAIVTAVTMDGFDVVEALTGEVFAWIGAHGAAPSGPPFVRIVTSDMSGELDIEVGVPLDDPPAGDDRFVIGSIPRGTYVTLIYTVADDHDHYQANVELQAWAANQGVEWEIDRSSGVEISGGRFEFFRSDLSSEGKPVFELTYQISDSAAT
jgi:effector-binding domain-containing protein